MPEPPRILFLCHGAPGSPAVARAEAFVACWGAAARCRVVPRVRALRRDLPAFWAALRKDSPDLVWVIDVSPAGVLAALGARARGGPRVVIDTGDAIFALARAAALRGPLGLGLTWALEELAYRGADAIVVRGTGHERVLAPRGCDVTTIQDGVDLELFHPQSAAELRAVHAPRGELLAGFVGSLTWKARRGSCYGWELVEALALLPEGLVRGLVVGDGPGLARLQARARALGVAHRVDFVGRVALERLPPLLNAMDVALSTQSNDLVGRVRTTGKLPLYLACGRFVLATRVGEAAHVLDEQQLLDHAGAHDPAYPSRLADRLRELQAQPERLAAVREANVERARERFAYPLLAARALALVDRLRGAG